MSEEQVNKPHPYPPMNEFYEQKREKAEEIGLNIRQQEAVCQMIEEAFELGVKANQKSHALYIEPGEAVNWGKWTELKADDRYAPVSVVGVVEDKGEELAKTYRDAIAGARRAAEQSAFDALVGDDVAEEQISEYDREQDILEELARKLGVDDRLRSDEYPVEIRWIDPYMLALTTDVDGVNASREDVIRFVNVHTDKSPYKFLFKDYSGVMPVGLFEEDTKRRDFIEAFTNLSGEPIDDVTFYDDEIGVSYKGSGTGVFTYDEIINVMLQNPGNHPVFLRMFPEKWCKVFADRWNEQSKRPAPELEAPTDIHVEFAVGESAMEPYETGAPKHPVSSLIEAESVAEAVSYGSYPDMEFGETWQQYCERTGRTGRGETWQQYCERTGRTEAE